VYSIDSADPCWQPSANKPRQRVYIALCMQIRTLKLLRGGSVYDAKWRGWLQEEHGLVSDPAAEAGTFKIQSSDKLDEKVEKLEKERKDFVFGPSGTGTCATCPTGPQSLRRCCCWCCCWSSISTSFVRC